MSIKITNELLDLTESGARLGLPRNVLCSYIGVHKRTMYHWIQKGQLNTSLKCKYRRFWLALKRGEAQNAASNMMIINQQAQEGQWTAAAWIMERRHNMVKSAPDTSTMDDEDVIAEPGQKNIDEVFTEYERLGLIK